MKLSWQVFLVLLVMFEVAADVAAKEFQLSAHLTWAIASLALYVLANSFWLVSLRQGSTLSVGACIFSVASAILAVIVGAGVYHEAITPPQWAGIGLGVVSLALVTWGEA